MSFSYFPAVLEARLIYIYKTVHDSWRGIATEELIVMIVAYSPDAWNMELGRIPEEVSLWAQIRDEPTRQSGCWCRQDSL